MSHEVPRYYVGEPRHTAYNHELPVTVGLHGVRKPTPTAGSHTVGQLVTVELVSKVDLSLPNWVRRILSCVQKFGTNRATQMSHEVPRYYVGEPRHTAYNHELPATVDDGVAKQKEAWVRNALQALRVQLIQFPRYVFTADDFAPTSCGPISRPPTRRGRPTTRGSPLATRPAGTRSATTARSPKRVRPASARRTWCLRGRQRSAPLRRVVPGRPRCRDRHRRRRAENAAADRRDPRLPARLAPRHQRDDAHLVARQCGGPPDLSVLPPICTILPCREVFEIGSLLSRT